MSTVIRIVAAVLVDDDGRVLLVRKRGTTSWMQPGGKIETGERADDALARELHEELGLVLDTSTFEYWGRFEADAANEPDHTVDSDVYLVRVNGPVAVAAEIEELRWIELGEDHGLTVAPLSELHLFPLLAERRGTRPLG